MKIVKNLSEIESRVAKSFKNYFYLDGIFPLLVQVGGTLKECRKISLDRISLEIMKRLGIYVKDISLGKNVVYFRKDKYGDFFVAAPSSAPSPNCKAIVQVDTSVEFKVLQVLLL